MNSWFAFKRFTVRQEGAAMKVGTDGVLLGAWARVEPWQKRLFDVGTGTGLIALMLAQRTAEWSPAIDAIEIDEVSFRQASENFRSSPWSGRLHAAHLALSDHVGQMSSSDKRGGRELSEVCKGGIYDHIISNPPYFTDSLKAPEARRAAARHADSLPYGELAAGSAELLTATGLLSVIIPFDGETLFRRETDRYGFHIARRTIVRSLPHTPPKRVMLEFSLSRSDAPAESELLIETAAGGNYSDEYRRLTQDFYLKF